MDENRRSSQEKHNSNHIQRYGSDSGYRAVQITAILWLPVEAFGMSGSEPAAGRKKKKNKLRDPPSVIDAFNLQHESCLAKSSVNPLHKTQKGQQNGALVFALFAE